MSDDRTPIYIEMYPVLLDAKGAIALLHPTGEIDVSDGCWSVLHTSGHAPDGAVAFHLRRVFGSEGFDAQRCVVRSMSWRYITCFEAPPRLDAIFLVYLAVLQPADAAVAWRLLEQHRHSCFQGRELVFDSCVRPADRKDVGEVLPEALSQLAYLARYDAGVASTLSPEWHCALAEWQPRALETVQV